ncbi:phage protein Gp27 family protein [Inquilinus sp. CA228]|uniref:phage protein Gp27 family protein n=1 Tax=Inquilinus sp. CA228 TaxID=3455609 RepID=UPI003F8CF669
MARPSKIDRLPGEFREAIGRLREQGHTIDEILAHLRSLGVDTISRTGLGEHVQKLDAIGERIRQSRAMARELVERYGEAGEDRLARLNIELLHDLVFRLQTAVVDGEPVQLSTLDAQRLSATLRNAQTSARADIDLARAKKVWADEQKKKLAAVEAEIEAAGPDAKPDPAAVLKRIREDVYGIFT